jgi:hypothetical protein
LSKKSVYIKAAHNEESILSIKLSIKIPSITFQTIRP